MVRIIFILLCLLSNPVFAADDPCSSLLSVINRPTFSDSVCVVKTGRVLVESGIEYQSLYPIIGQELNLPEAAIRFGLPKSNEIEFLLPNYIDQGRLGKGSQAAELVFKHQFPYTKKWVYAWETIGILPSGTSNFGSEGLGLGFGGLVSYAINDKLSLSFNLDVVTQTTSVDEGGQRFTNLDPFLVVAWQFNDAFQWYAEVYGQSKTGPNQGAGFNADTGFQYLITKDVEVDIEYGHRLSGFLSGYEEFVGVGGAVRLF